MVTSTQSWRFRVHVFQPYYPLYHIIPYQTNLPHFASIRKYPLLRVWIRDIADKLYISLTIFTETCRNAGKVEYLSDPPPNSFKSCMILSTNTWGEVQPHTGVPAPKKWHFLLGKDLTKSDKCVKKVQRFVYIFWKMFLTFLKVQYIFL